RRVNGDAGFPEGAALVVGGSGGIGSEICGRLADAGSDVALTYRSNRGAADATAANVSAAGRRVHAFALDLGDGEAVRSAFDGVAARFGRIHTVVFAIGAEI